VLEEALRTIYQQLGCKSIQLPTCMRDGSKLQSALSFQPLGGRQMGKAIAACMKKYAVFSGRSSRREMWLFFLFYMIFYVSGSIIGGALAVSSDNIYMVNVVQWLFVLPFFLPMLAAQVRRAHDTGRSGWFLLIPIYNIVILASAGNPGSNKYGEPVA